MKIKNFSVKNYRSFEDETSIELRPLTLLFGYNSQGKSALLRTLPLLAASVRGPASSPLNLDTELSREGGFANLLCRLNGTPSLSFGLGFESQPGELERLEIRLREDSKSRRQFVEHLHVRTTEVEPAMDLDWDLEFPNGAPLNYKAIFSLEISPRDQQSLRIPIVDTGEGMIQVLPVLVLAAMAKVGRLGESPILALEHPELYLHPAAHAELAEIFCEVARGDGPTLLVETHSENILRQVQLAIARGEIKPEQVLIYWIRQDAVGRSTAEPIEFDELAIPVGYKWPTGVFSEASELASKLISLRRQLRLSGALSKHVVLCEHATELCH